MARTMEKKLIGQSKEEGDVRSLATDEGLFPTYLVRCFDKGSGGLRGFVGDFGRGGLNVERRWNAARIPLSVCPPPGRSELCTLKL